MGLNDLIETTRALGAFALFPASVGVVAVTAFLAFAVADAPRFDDRRMLGGLLSVSLFDDMSETQTY